MAKKEEAKKDTVTASNTTNSSSEEKSISEKKQELKNKIAQAKAQLNNLAVLIEKCEGIKQQRKLIISEDDTNKKPEEVFKFALTGSIVLDIMSRVDDFISEMKNRTIAYQDQLIDELNELI